MIMAFLIISFCQENHPPLSTMVAKMETKSLDGSHGKGMRKSAHPSGGMGSSNPRHWRGWRLHHHGGGVC